MVSVLNKSTVVSDNDLSKLVELTNFVMARDFAPAYERLFGANHWQFVIGGTNRIKSYIVDRDADVPGALAYHDLRNGKPVAVTMAATILDSGASMFGPDGVLSAHLHEAEEMFNDAACNLIARGPDGRYRWREVCDAVQGEDYEVGGDYGKGAYAPNFCKSHWFNPESPDDDLDFQRSRSEPFEVAPQGYQVISTCGDETQVFGKGYIEGADGAQRGGGLSAWRTLHLTGIGE